MKKKGLFMRKCVVMMLVIVMNIVILCQCNVYAAQGPYTIGYSSHLQDIGWIAYKYNGAMSGTTGQNRQMEAIKISLGNLPGGITYRTHVQDEGWHGWKSNGEISGTTGKNRQIEAIQIKLTGIAADTYNVMYRTHIQDEGWQSWKSNGEMSGTTGKNRQIEAIQIKLTPKNHPTISKVTLKNIKVQLYNNTAAYSKLYYMIDETGSKYLVSVAYDKNGKIISYAPWLVPLDDSMCIK